MEFELEKFNRNTPDEDLLSDLNRVAIKIKKSPTMDEYNELGTYHSTTLTRRFGGWFRTLEAAELGKSRSPLNISPEDLFQNMEEVWTRLGRQPRYIEFQKPLSKYSAGTYENRFGSLDCALFAGQFS